MQPVHTYDPHESHVDLDSRTLQLMGKLGSEAVRGVLYLVAMEE